MGATPTIQRMPGLRLVPAHEDLLRRAFVNQPQIFVEREFRSGYSGASTYLISRQGLAPLVAKIAHTSELKREFDAYHQLVKDTSPQNTAHLQGELLINPTGDLALVTYAFAGGDPRLPTTNLLGYYTAKGGAATAEALDRIFRTYGRQWWANNALARHVYSEDYDPLLPPHLQLITTNADDEPAKENPNLLWAGAIDLAALRALRPGQYVQLDGFTVTRARASTLYLSAPLAPGERSAPIRLRLEGDFGRNYRPGDLLTPQLAQIKATRQSLLVDVAYAAFRAFDPAQDHFSAGNLVFLNPLHPLDALLDSAYDAKISIIHGDLNLNNVLVDETTGFSWLIDFADTRRGPALLDLQRLEVQIITKLLPALPNLTGLADTHLSEAHLSDAHIQHLVQTFERLHSQYPPSQAVTPAWQEPYTIWAILRRLARQYLVDDRQWGEYYNGLALALLGALKFEELAASARGLAFLSAATALRLAQSPLAEPTGEEIINQVQTPAPGVPPFKGLQFFNLEDADLYFGREQLVAQLIDQLGSHRFLAVVGASGSGKSSLVRAGLLPALQRNTADHVQWPVHLITPGANPLRALALSLTRHSQRVGETTGLIDDLAADARSLDLYVSKLLTQQVETSAMPPNASSHLVLVIDQFEEVFTLCRNREERKAFVDNLMTAAGLASTQVGAISDGPTIVVITLRADFYAHCAEFENLRCALETHQKYIGAMNSDELRRAIVLPAEQNRWKLEPGLVDLLLADVGDEPGALPLLSHALLETWNRRSGRVLTLAGYGAAGRVQGAIAQTAERVFHQQLTPDQRTIARSIFLRLTELGEGSQDTRRRVALPELLAQSAQAGTVEAVLKKLVDARLVTTFANEAEVAHEALIREWPQLREWLADDREGLRIHRRLTEATQEWLSLQRDASELLRGPRLSQTLEWVGVHQDDLNAQEREYLEQSRLAVEQAEQEKEQARQREIAQAQALASAQQQRAEEQAAAANRLQRRNLWLRLASASAVLFAVVALWFGWQASRNEEQAKRNAVEAQQQSATAVASQNEAEEQRANAQARAEEANRAQIAAQQAALNAEQEAWLARTSLLASYSQLMGQDRADRANNIPLLLAREAVLSTWIADARLITQPYVTSAADTALRLAIANAPPLHLTLPLHQPGDGVTAVRFTSNGTLLATASEDNTVRLWEVANGRQRVLLPHNGVVTSVALSMDDQWLAAACDDGWVYLWEVTTGRLLRRLAGHNQEGNRPLSVDFSADGRFLLTAGSDKNVLVRQVSDAQIIQEVKGERAAFSADGQWIVTSQKNEVRVWNAASGELLTTFDQHSKAVRQAIFHPDGEMILSVGDDGRVLLWSHTGEGEVRQIGEEMGKLTTAAISPDGRWLAIGGEDEFAQVWSLDGSEPHFSLTGHVNTIYSLRFSPDSQRLVSSDDAGIVKLWEVVSKTELDLMPGHTDDIFGLAFSPDGKVAATASDDKSIGLWEVATGVKLSTLRGHTGDVRSVAFSSDGRQLLSAAADATVRLWDVASQREVVSVTVPITPVVNPRPTLVNSAHFLPNRPAVLITSYDRTVRLWDGQANSPARPIITSTTLINAVALSPDGRLVATGDDQGEIFLWQVESGALLWRRKEHEGLLRALAFDPSGKILASGGNDNSVRLWEVATGQRLQILYGHEEPIFAIDFSPDGARLVTGSQDWSVRLWEVSSARQLARLDGHEEGVWAVRFNPAGTLVLSAGDDATARLWAVDGRTSRYPIQDDKGDVNVVRFSPDGSWFVAGYNSGLIVVRDTVTGEEIDRLSDSEEAVTGLAISGDGQRLVVAQEDGVVQRLDLAHHTPIGEPLEHEEEVSALSFSRDERLIVTAAGETAWLWSSESEEAARPLQGHEGQIVSLALDPNGQVVVTSGQDKRLIVWDVNSAKEITRMTQFEQEISTLAFDQAGQRLVGAGKDGVARLWDVITWREVASFGHNERVVIAAFSPDGRLLLTATDDGTLHLWQIDTGQEIRTIKEQSAQVNSAVFSPDGRWILSGDEEGDIYLWVATVDDLLAQADSLVRREPPFLLASERNRFGIKVVEHD